MKPDQLNRLIRVNTRMQPWFLRNTSELYESAVRTYYEHNRHSRFRAENVGPLRRVKRSQPVPSPAEIYPRSHVLQADQLLYTMKQASHPRSMSFSATRPYASAYGQGSVGRRKGSSSCSSASSSGSSRTEIMVGSLRKSKARRERKRSLHKSRDSKEDSMGGGMFSARSVSLPPLPTAPTASGASRGPMMPPSRQHHMAAMAKTALAQPTRVPRGEGDSLMPVDAALKRRISVLSHLESGRSPGGRQPSEMRFRFQTLGDRIKQFEYIQFADGPVATYAFNRSQRRPITSTAQSPRSRIEDTADITATRRVDVRQQPRQLSFHNVLHANYRQRSRSLESGAVQLMESLAPVARPETPLGPRGIGGQARGSSLDSSSRTSFRPGTSTVTWSNTLGRSTETLPDDYSGNRSVGNFGYSKSSEETSGDWDAKPGEDWCKYPRSSSSLGTGFGPNLTLAETTSRGNFGISSGAGKKLRSIEESSGGEASGSAAGSSEKCKAGSGSFSGQDEPSRATVAPVRRLQLQQRSLQTSPKVDEEPSLSAFEVKDKPVKKKMKLVSQPDKPRVTKVISNQVSRSSHRSFFQPSEEPDLPAGHPSKTKASRDQKPQKKPEKEQKREPSLKGANQLLVASASQVSAYKRAFRTQQQMLKAEILHQQAQHLQESQKKVPAEKAKQAPKLQSHRGSIPNTNRSTNRPTVRRSAASPLDEGVSKAGAGTQAPRTAKLGTEGSELKKRAYPELPVKTKAAPVTAHLTAKRTAQMTAAKKGALKMGALTGGGGGGGRAVTEPAVATKTRRSALTLAAQQQQSRSGNSLLGFRRETVNRAAAALLQRRDADEPLSQLPLQSQSQSPSAQQRRQFHFPYPPWRPSY